MASKLAAMIGYRRLPGGLRRRQPATGFVYTGGELHDEKVDVIGPGSLEGQDFPFSEVDPQIQACAG
jgi:hypothetical protein